MESINNPFQEVYEKVPPKVLYEYGPRGLLFHCSHATMENTFRADLEAVGLGHTAKELTRYNGYDVVFDDSIPEGEVFITNSDGEKIELDGKH